ncbi:MAG: AAA family ATPase [Nitrospiria bacterium]
MDGFLPEIDSMYLKFFGFKEPPFKLVPDPHFFYCSKKHDEALSHIQYGLKERKGFIVIVGEVGTGKTTLCRLLLGKLDPSIQSALLFNPQLSAIELLQSINQDFGLNGKSRSKKKLIDELNHFLLGLLYQGKTALLIIDEAQLLSIGCMEEIRLLSNLETDQEKLIQILLIGQPELKEKLAFRSLRQLKQRISLIHEIGPLARDEVALYIQSRLRVAGGADSVTFAPRAIDRIVGFSHGFPRLINIVADQALLAAYVANATYVTESLVAQAIGELEKGTLEPTSIPAERKIPSERRRVVSAFLFLFFGLLLLAGGWYWRDRLITGIDLLKTKMPTKATPTISSPPTPSVIVPTEVETSPVSVPDDVPQESQAASPPLQRFDEDGVFRVENIPQTKKGASLTLLNLWVPLSSEDRWEGEGLEAVRRSMGENEIASYPVPLDLEEILALDLPVLISSGNGGDLHYRVLAGVKGEEAVILDPLTGKVATPVAELTEGWQGTGTIFWRGIEGIKPPFMREREDQSVKKIQEILKREGYYFGPVDGLWGGETRKALLSFQEKEGINRDGLWGPETHLHLAKKVNDHYPSLK